MWQQNTILQRQNEIFAKQEGADVQPARTWPKLRRYWPMLTMVLLVVLVWVPYVYTHYHPAKGPQQIDIPEFDGPTAELIGGWGQDTSASCYMSVNGKLLLSRQSEYKLAIACFAYDGKEDILDAPYLQVSNLYDIKDGTVVIRGSYQPYFIDYSKQIHSVGIEVALLNVPNGIQPSQFTTLRQARALGVKILSISIAKSEPGGI